jgi:hypothetical protein
VSTLRARLDARAIDGLRLYDPSLHAALFAPVMARAAPGSVQAP